MKKILSILLLMLMATTASWAQMTDDQVIDYVKSQNAAGVSQNQIAKDLVAKGVTQDQMLRIKRNYESSKESSSTVHATMTEAVDREREVNGEIEQAKASDTKVIFGHDVFRSKNLTFEPNMNIATPASYILGPGDEVILDIYGASQSNGSFKIAPDGCVNIPNEGPVNVAGLTVTQAQAKVRKAIGMHYQGSTIKLSVGQTRTILVNVMGEVSAPGTYSLSAFSTVFNALYLAGGITDIGTMRSIKVSRNGKIITTVDVYDFIVNGKLTGNIMLRDNDVIMVGPYENLVKVEGRIKRPMFYEMKKNESLQSLLNYAGGFMGDAYKEKVRVERKSSEGLTVHNIDEWDFTTFHNEDGDVVVISPIIERYKNTVTVNGAVFRPGSYKIDTKVNTVKTIIEQAGGLLEQAMTNRAVLRRMKADRTRSTIAIDLAGIMSGRTPDVPLQNEDEITIASFEDISNSRILKINGEVLNPGSFEYSENTTIEDLITLAGGLTEAATLDNVEVSRRITSAADNPDGNQMAKVFTFNLKDGLEIDKTTDFKLQPFDAVTIHRNPNYKTQRHVYIGGEVQYAGFYTLTNKEERLSDLVARAGGLTSKAYINGAQLIRKYTKSELDVRQSLLEIATNAADSLTARRAIYKKDYTVGIDLSNAIKSKGSVDDIILAEGDSIYVPQLSNVVKISGEVLHPNTVTYIKGKGANYYLNQAGGITDEARKKRAYIVYANGQVSTLKKGDIEPGSEIIVPSKKEKKVDVAKVSMWATLASTVATVGAVVSNIVK